MGHKINPIIFRTGITRLWPSKWFNKKDYQKMVEQDIKVRKFLKDKLKEAGIDKIEIERTTNAITFIIYAARPGLIIGRRGEGAEKIKKEVYNKFFKKDKMSGIVFNLNIQELDKPGLSAAVAVQNIIVDIEKRVPYRRVMKQTIDKIMKAGAKGAKVMIGGRLGGAEIARTEKLAVGKVPLHTLRADVDYSRGTARTIYGAIGVKVWIYRGEIFEDKKKVNSNMIKKEETPELEKVNL